MHVQLSSVGKRFNKEWILRNVNLEILSGEKCAIIGANGSGKSSLLKMISGFVMPTEGKLIYTLNDSEIPFEKLYKHISFSAPYLDFIEDFSIEEILHFHKKLKNVYSDEVFTAELNNCGLAAHKNKAWKNLSSGMKQRLRIIAAFLTHSELLLLDEPCANLDNSGIEWYRTLINTYCQNKTVLVGSNSQAAEYDFCGRTINTSNLKS